MKTYEIQLKADFIDAEKHDILVQICREKAQELYTAALMLKDTREPQIALQAGDLFEGTKKFAVLAEDQEKLEAGE